jgi:Putative rhamnosyl transferase
VSTQSFRGAARPAADEHVYHVVLTRFNVRTYVTGATDVVSPEWVRRRLELFETFCLPSMQAQSAPYEWLVFFDAGTPADLRRRFESHSGYTPVWVQGVLEDEQVIDHVAERLPSQATTLITTRLDNDDGVASDFVAQIQDAARGEHGLFLNFPLGYQWERGRLYYYVHTANPFLSFVERVPATGADGSPITVMSGHHETVARSGRLRQVWSPPTWLQVVHGDNVINERMGVRRPSARPPARFPAIPLATDGWADRHLGVAKSVGHLAGLAWKRRERISRRLTRRAQGV